MYVCMCACIYMIHLLSLSIYMYGVYMFSFWYMVTLVVQVVKINTPAEEAGNGIHLWVKSPEEITNVYLFST